MESSIGGAWGLRDCLGLQAVEISPHTIVPDPIVHKVIAEKFQVELETVTPEPVYRYWEDEPTAKEYPLHNVLGECMRDLFYRAKVARKDRGSMKETVLLPIEILTNYRALRKFSKTAIVYPKGGLVRLLKNAEKILKDLGVEISCNTKANRVDWNSSSGGYFKVSTSNGEFEGKCVALPRIIHLESFGYDGIDVPAYRQDNHSTHFVLKTRTSQKGQLRFLKVNGSPFFELINDVTPYCLGDLSENERVVSCRCVRSVVFNEGTVDDYVQHLRDLDYLPEGDELLDYQVNEVEDSVLAYYMHPRLKRLFGEKLVFLGAFDGHITNAIRNFNSARWNFA